MQRLIDAIYPPQCLTCDALVTQSGLLCANCWRETPLIQGLVCDLCGTPLPGDAATGQGLHCDECLTLARPWDQGRAAMMYGDKARRILLGLKYYDRQDYAPACCGWLERSALPILLPGMLVAPVPLHWLRLLKRRYNQSAILSQGLARRLGFEHCADLLVRTRHTGTQDGRGRHGRFENLQGAIAPHPRQGPRIAGRDILLVDDVMTAGATFAAASDACLGAGARSVRVVALARVARTG